MGHFVGKENLRGFVGVLLREGEGEGEDALLPDGAFGADDCGGPLGEVGLLGGGDDVFVVFGLKALEVAH